MDDKHEIGLDDVFINLLRHKKLFLCSFFTIIICSAIFAYIKTVQVVTDFSEIISGPSYIENGRVNPLIAKETFSHISQVYFDKFQSINSQNSVIRRLKIDTKKSANAFTLSYTGPLSKRDDFHRISQDFVRFYNQQFSYKAYVSSWKSDIEFKITELTRINNKYNQDLDNFVSKMEKIESFDDKEDIGNKNIIALTMNLTKMISDYKVIVAQNKNKIMRLSSKVNSLQAKVTDFDGTLLHPPKGIAKNPAMILILGLILGIIFSSMLVFLKIFFSSINQKIKVGEADPDIKGGNQAMG